MLLYTLVSGDIIVDKKSTKIISQTLHSKNWQLLTHSLSFNHKKIIADDPCRTTTMTSSYESCCLQQSIITARTKLAMLRGLVQKLFDFATQLSMLEEG